MSALLLSKPQAEAFYSALCALNNIGASTLVLKFKHVHLDSMVKITYIENFCLQVYVESTGAIEKYNEQNEFAAAYELA